ncbi:biotin transporter BioY [Falsirhodobacter algicola]|uniref:Biotin transporter n=1 Tax=Falsirhodobacter algicola TaxID=2692330 RepID=A0A8J8SLM4_9RHOB|nr:biotin transporter BioY [Falsirhodobacter algicola]QUS36688.1 BioY family transporter [Falsirhodobacter algicola]
MERNLSLIALFAALIAALAMMPQIHLPMGVPITAQSLGIMLCGTVLGPKRGALAVGLYMLVAAMGLPILAGGRGGLAPFVGPSAGFIWGWPVAAMVTGWIMGRWRGGVGLTAFCASVIGCILVLYPFGIVGLWLLAPQSTALPTIALSMAVFLPGDLLKAVLAAGITQTLARARPQSLLSRN